jgi:hypothetical protein
MAFPQQQWLGVRSSMLRYTYIACLAVLKVVINETVCVSNILGLGLVFSHNGMLKENLPKEV